MKILLVLALVSSALLGAAADAPASGPAIVIDCAKPALPSQREVGEMAGQYNFSQVYDTRARLMAEARRACQREGTTKVRLVKAAPSRGVTSGHVAQGTTLR